MSASPGRTIAREVVTQVRERSGYAHEVLDARLRAANLSPEEAAFATRLAYGTIQTQGTLNEAIDRYLSGKRIEPRVRDALGVSAYELLFSATPDRAAVHQGVELVRRVRTQATGLANAVLRRLAEDAPDFPWGDPETDTAALARKEGHPLWLAELWVSELGRDTAEQVMAADNEPAPLYVAVNQFAVDEEHAVAALEDDGAQPASCVVPGCLRLGDPAKAVHGKAMRESLVLACDATAQLVASLVPVHPESEVVEVGSGRGTKTVLLQAAAIALGGPARIYAVDLHDFKSQLLRRRLDTIGVPWVTELTGDARDMSSIPGAPAAQSVDGVFIDAPCSGLGTLRRHPEKRWRVTPADIEALGDLGLQLLREAAGLVRPGGFVVYSTCTIASRENADVVRAFLGSEQGGGWRIDPLAEEIPAEWRHFVTDEGFYSSYPVSGGADGHFVARLIKD